MLGTCFATNRYSPGGIPMLKYTSRCAASLLVAATLLGACSSEKKGPDTTALGADSALNRDLAMANRDSAAQPQLKDVPATTTPAPAPTTTRPQTRTPTTRTTPTRPAPRPATQPTTPTTKTTPSGNTVSTSPGTNPSSGGGAVGTIPAGATLNTHANARICTNTNAVGDHVTATVENSVSGSNGAMIPAGATVNMTVTQLKRSENTNDKIIKEFAVNSVTFNGHTYPIEATVASAAVDRIKDQPQSKDIQKVAIGAAAGAIAGK